MQWLIFLQLKKKALACYFFALAAFGLPGFSSGVTKPIGRFGGVSGGVINSRIASNTCFNCTRVLCEKVG